MALVLYSWQKSIASLELGLSAYKEAQDLQLNTSILETLKAGVVQNFEIVYRMNQPCA